MAINPLIANLQKNKLEIDPSIGKWFRFYRESYDWPSGTGRKESELKIRDLQSSIQLAIIDRNNQNFAVSLEEIHRWKNGNQRDISCKYRKNLDMKGSKYISDILGLAPFDNTENLSNLIRKLKISGCNLPTCSAIASFIYNRKDVPIIDRFIAQFFARKFQKDTVDEETARILQYVKKIPFTLQDDGKGKLRPAVYYSAGFEDNLSKYIDMLIPECSRIAQDLLRINIQYCDIDEHLTYFSPVDVEMAIFSYAMKHSGDF